MLGFLFGMLTRPHAIGPAGIQPATAPRSTSRSPGDDIESVDPTQARSPEQTTEGHGGRRREATLHLRMQNETSIEVQLRGPIEVRLPHGPETMSKVTVYADDPDAFMKEVRRARPS